MKKLILALALILNMTAAFADKTLAETETYLTGFRLNGLLNTAQLRTIREHIHARKAECDNAASANRLRNCYLTARLYSILGEGNRNPTAGRAAYTYVQTALRLSNTHAPSISLISSMGLRFVRLSMVERPVVEHELGLTGDQIIRLALDYCHRVNDTASNCAQLRSAYNN